MGKYQFKAGKSFSVAKINSRKLKNFKIHFRVFGRNIV